MNGDEIRKELIKEGFTHVRNPYGQPIPLRWWDRCYPEECHWMLVTYLEDRQTFAIRCNPDGSVRDEYQILGPTAVLEQHGKTYGPWPISRLVYYHDSQVDAVTKAAEKMGATHGYAQYIIRDAYARSIYDETVVV